MIAAATKRGRSRNDSNTRPGSKKIPVKVCPVDIAAASVVSETGTGGGGGGTKSLLLGSLIVLSSVVDRGRGDVFRPHQKKFRQRYVLAKIFVSSTDYADSTDLDKTDRKHYRRDSPLLSCWFSNLCNLRNLWRDRKSTRLNSSHGYISY